MKPDNVPYQPLFLSVAYLLAVLLLAPPVLAIPSIGDGIWNSDGDFAAGLPYDSGQRADECYSAALWGRYSWGVEGAGIHREGVGRTIALAHFIANGEGAYLYGREEQGYGASVRYTQGTAWGQSACGAIPWNRPAPLPTHGQQLTLSVDVHRGASRLLSGDGEIALTVRVWLASPALPKPLALELILYHSAPEQVVHFEDSAYHYRYIAGTTSEGEWQSWVIPLNGHLAAALVEFDLTHAADTLRITQLDFAIELKQAEGAATMDNLFLRYTSFTPTPTATPTPPVQAETETPTPTATFPISYETDVPTETPTPTPPVQAETETPTPAATDTLTAVRSYHFLPLLLK